MKAFFLASALLVGLAPAALAEPDPELVRIQELAEPVRAFDSFCEFDLKTLPAVGFYPLGGDGASPTRLSSSASSRTRPSCSRTPSSACASAWTPPPR